MTFVDLADHGQVYEGRISGKTSLIPPELWWAALQEGDSLPLHPQIATARRPDSTVRGEVLSPTLALR